ncbi:MAG TPA: TetR/AcrR family transcriptional regulator [Terriglobales bacterium]|nr:TetR/AcrR family transcriptional regulator [Terriglobales bacterium]
MGVKERREREKSETRDRILDAARELFIVEGYAGVSMRRVAEKIEYSPTAIYVHFADKEELFRELCHQDYARLAEVFQSSAMSSNPIERLREIGKIYIEFGLRNPNHYKFMFMTPHPAQEPDDEDREIMGNPEKDAYAFLKWAVQQALDGGCFREELRDAELISQTLWASVHGVISLEIAKGCDAWVDWRPVKDRVEVMLDSTLRGLVRKGPLLEPTMISPDVESR